MPIAVLDIDGVLTRALDYVDEVGRRYNRPDIRGESLMQYDMAKQWPDAPKSWWDEVMSDPEFVRGMKPLPAAKDGVWQLYGMGYEIRLLTSRPIMVRDATWAWTTEHFCCISYIRFTFGKPKAEVLQKMNRATINQVRLFVDDCQENVTAVAHTAVQTEILCCVFGWPYNNSLWDWPAIVKHAKERIEWPKSQKS